MKPTYSFERKEPPVLNENMLRAALERRKQNRLTALFVLAAALFLAAAGLLGYAALDWYPWLSAACFAYLIISATGCGVIAVVYSRTRKGGAVS